MVRGRGMEIWEMGITGHGKGQARREMGVEGDGKDGEWAKLQ
jgi:hypothetical protein